MMINCSGNVSMNARHA